MHVRQVAVAALALMVLLSGCSAFSGTLSDDPASENETENDPDELASNETADDGGGNETDDDEERAADDPDSESSDGSDDTADDGSDSESDDSTDDTADAAWSPPQEPNRPMEDKREDRIHSVTFVDRVPAADGEGYSNFNLEVVANTSMANVDPPEHGDVVGEPYFFVKINEDEDKIVERTGQVSMKENGTFHIPVRPAGIEEYGNQRLTVEVFLMDKDKDWDDIYDSWGGTIHFNPESDADEDEDESGDGDETDDADADDGADADGGEGEGEDAETDDSEDVDADDSEDAETDDSSGDEDDSSADGDETDDER